MLSSCNSLLSSRRFAGAASFLLSLVLPFSYCQDLTVIADNMQTCIEDGQFEIGVDYFPNKFIPREYVPSFFPNQVELDNTTDYLTIEYFDYYKIVTNKFINRTYLFYQCGAQPPQDEVDSGRHNLILPVPHRGGVAITETPQIPSLELLGLRTEIIAYVGDPQYVSSPCLNYMIDVANTTEVVFDPSDPWNTTKLDALTAEFLERNPEAVIFGGIFSNPDAPRSIGVAETQERTNVATFDWIALYAALYNMEAMSNEITAETEARYSCSSVNAHIISADLPEEERPTVLWANFVDGYNWSVAECPTWDHTYYCEYARHCGANIISRPEGLGYAPESLGGAYWYVNDEELLAIGKDADIWIYPAQDWATVYESKKEILDQFNAVQNELVYDTQGGGQFGWYEQRYAEYDVVGLDFCQLVGNTNPNQFPPHQVKWFRNLAIAGDEVPPPGTCDVPDELDNPYVPVGATCEPLESDPAREDDYDEEGSTEGGDNAGGSGGSVVVGRFMASLLGAIILVVV
jgi:hypothetical protein